MSKNVANLEQLLESAGVDIGAMKASLAALDEAFGGEAGDIPNGALDRWVNEHVDTVKSKAFFIAVGKAWEAALDVPEDRKWEKAPNAAEIKRKKNEEKAKAKK